MLFDVQAALSEILTSTPATPATIATNTSKPPPLSRVSRLSQEVDAESKIPKSAPHSPRAAIMRALRAGLKTPGSIATAAKLGATETYQELDRMAQAGLVLMHRDGALQLVASADPEAAE